MAATPADVDVLVLTGPTTSGKTALSIEVALSMNGEIVSADSRQVYRGMDIGTDKVGLPERGRVPHHGLDLVDPSERYSAGQFVRDATRVIRGIASRGRVPVVVGGTGFFLKALGQPLFNEPSLDPDRRTQLAEVLHEWDAERLARGVRQLDPDRAEVAVAGGRQRMMRTIEVALLTGAPLSHWHRVSPPAPSPFRLITVVLDVPREVVDQRIDERVDRMVERGFVDEVSRLLAAGFSPAAPGMTGTGYRDVAAFLAGKSTLDEALENVRLQTRQYARRQWTWFRHQLDGAAWVDEQSVADRVRVVNRIWEDR